MIRFAKNLSIVRKEIGQRKLSSKLLSCFVALAVLATAQVAMAIQVKVTIKNLTPDGSVALSPFTVLAHDGTFDAFNSGDSAAGTGIENVAEGGNGALLISEINGVQPSAVTDTLVATNGGFGPGIFLPGAFGSTILTLDPSLHRFFTYGSMVVPSNDAFLGNDDPMAVELFDAGGNFMASNFILTGADIWDAGTEVNQLFGAAYVVGQSGGLGDDEGGVVHMDLANQFPYLGEDVPSGGQFTVIPMAGTPVAAVSFQVVPEPATMLLLGMGLLGLACFRKKKRT